MIISASRRTDIPALYSKWFLNRLTEGVFLIPNPYNDKVVTKIRVTKDNVDCIVFWTKDASGIMDKLERVDEMGYKYYFQYTVTGYGSDIEKNLWGIDKRIENFILLSEKIGRNKVVWRYDPIFVNDKYSVDWHLETFEYLCSKLFSYTNRSIISYIDIYKRISGDFR